MATTAPASSWLARMEVPPLASIQAMSVGASWYCIFSTTSPVRVAVPLVRPARTAVYWMDAGPMAVGVHWPV